MAVAEGLVGPDSTKSGSLDMAYGFSFIGFWGRVVMADPEGDEFCVLRSRRP